jgi:hypothetical protein
LSWVLSLGKVPEPRDENQGRGGCDRASTDADSTAELEIQLAGLKTLTVDDFYL